MKKTVVKTLAALATARRLFMAGRSTGPQEALATRGEVKPQKQERAEPATSPTKPQQHKRKYASIFVKLCVATIGLVASVVGIDAYVASRFDVLPVVTLDQSDPFSTLFEVANDSYLPFYGVTTACYVRDAGTP